MLTEEGQKTAEECQGRAGLGPTDYILPPQENEVLPVRGERVTTARARPSKSKSNQKATTLDVNKVSSKPGSS